MPLDLTPAIALALNDAGEFAPDLQWAEPTEPMQKTDFQTLFLNQFLRHTAGEISKQQLDEFADRLNQDCNRLYSEDLFWFGESGILLPLGTSYSLVSRLLARQFQIDATPSFQNKPYQIAWIIDFNYAYTIPDINPQDILSQVPPEVIALTQKGFCKIILDASYEGHFQSALHAYADFVAKFAETMGCDQKQICYLTQNHLLHNPEQQCFYFNVSLLDIASQAINQHLSPQAEQVRRRRKWFLCLNNMPRLHRAALLIKLFQNRLHAKGMISFNHKLDSTDLSLGDSPCFSAERLQPFFAEMPTRRLERLFDTINAKLPLHLDESSFDQNGRSHKIIQDIAISLYNQAYFSVVTESHFMDGTQVIRFSEKTLKPICGLHPFIVIGTPGVLKLLRDSGFQTFDGWIDESYDTLSDPVERLERVVQEIERLCALPREELQVWYSQISPILTHNFNHLVNEIPLQIQRQFSQAVFTPLS